MTVAQEKKVGLVLGEQLQKSGELAPEFIVRLRAVASDYKDGHLAEIVLSGGASSPQVWCEAEAAYDWLIRYEKLPAHCLQLERASLTTGQNIRYSYPVLQAREATHVAVYGRASQRCKTIIFIKYFWADHFKTTFKCCPDHKNLWYRVVDQTIMVIVALLDPKEQHLASWLNRTFRHFFVHVN